MTNTSFTHLTLNRITEGLLIQLHVCCIYRKNKIKSIFSSILTSHSPPLPECQHKSQILGIFSPGHVMTKPWVVHHHQGSASCAPTKFNYFPDISKVIWYFVLVSNSLQSFGGQYQFYHRLSLWLDHTPPRLPPGWSLTLSSLQSPDFRNFRLLGQNQSISREKLGVSWYLISFSSFWLTKNEHYLRFHWWPVCQYSLQKETFSSRFI